MRCTGEVFQPDPFLFDLFNEETKTRHEVANFAVLPCQRLTERDGTLVVDMQGRWLYLFVSQFLEKVPKEDNVLGAFDSGIHFCLSGAQSNHLLLLAAGVENTSVFSQREVNPRVRFGVLMGEESCVRVSQEFHDGAALSGIAGVVDELQMGSGV